MKLGLFFTTSVSLSTWKSVGNLDRELKQYIFLSKYFEIIYFFTYGGKNELSFQNNLPQNIKILPNKWYIPGKLYSFLLPFLYRKELQDVDIYKTNQMSGAWAALIAKYLFKKKLVVRCGYELLSLSLARSISRVKIIFLKFIEKKVYASADNIILTSIGDKRFVTEMFPENAKKIAIVPNYVDTELFKPLDALVKEEGKIIYVGRLHSEKNLVSLVKAMVGLPVKLLMIGDGPLKKLLQNLANSLGVALEVKGNIPNEQLPIEFRKSTVFVLPSFQEGCPKSLLEAMACGVACIGTDVAGINSVIVDGENGLLCAPDSESIHRTLLKLISNKALQEYLGRGARKTIEEQFSLDLVFMKELALYKNLLI